MNTAKKFLLFSLFLYVLSLIAHGNQSNAKMPLRTTNMMDGNVTEFALVGGGCFWCTEAVFEKLDGVIEVISGYAGGETNNPTYKEICTGKTGHAEVIRIKFDPRIISYSEILQIFGNAHDPTTLNRQGADVGTQYRSTVMFFNEEQKEIAHLWKEKLSKSLVDPVVTEIVPAPRFYPAEEYHQDFYFKNPNQGYCSFVIRPKLKKLGLE
jgi:peptide-methionine (S)-S-oxide reductase